MRVLDAEIEEGIEAVKQVCVASRLGFYRDPEVRMHEIVRFTLSADAEVEGKPGYRACTLDLSYEFVCDLPGTPTHRRSLESYLQGLRFRLGNVRPYEHMTLSGIPVDLEIQWPFRLASHGRDARVVSATAHIRALENSEATLSLRVTRRVEVGAVPIFETIFAESIVVNALRKAVDSGSIRFAAPDAHGLGLQNVVVSSADYDYEAKRFNFAHPNERDIGEFLKRKVYWLGFREGVKTTKVWIADPFDSEYLATTPQRLKQLAQLLSAEGFLHVDASGDFAHASDELLKQAEVFEGELRNRGAPDRSIRSRQTPLVTEPRAQASNRGGGTDMPRFGKWETVKELGKGGQGKVFLARDTTKLEIGQVAVAIKNSVKGVIDTTVPGEPLTVAKAHDLAQQILKYGRADDPAHCGALKVLRQPENPDEYEKQLGRMKHEVDALGKMNHPNVAKVLEANLDQRWFVMEYFPDEDLTKHLQRYKGDLLQSLLAVRPLVQAVAALHENKLVHRDIKPENIFFSPRGLVLGDFGLVYFIDDHEARLSETLENVGSRDWMPTWAQGLRLDEVRPTFDVFGLGKVLWSMIAGGGKVPLHYIHKPKFELEQMFAENGDIRWARRILDKCVVEDEENCLPNAGALLGEVDIVLSALRCRGQVISGSVARICRVCGLGRYKLVANDRDGARNFGLNPIGSDTFKVFSCTNCGHAELFYFPNGKVPAAWR